MKLYRYVGPAEIATAVASHAAGHRVQTAASLDRALAALDAEDGALLTYVVDAEGALRLADRHSEHVACAGGGPVLTAGEIAFEEDQAGWRVAHASNQSTGYCPEESSWASNVNCESPHTSGGWVCPVSCRQLRGTKIVGRHRLDLQ